MVTRHAAGRQSLRRRGAGENAHEAGKSLYFALSDADTQSPRPLTRFAHGLEWANARALALGCANSNVHSNVELGVRGHALAPLRRICTRTWNWAWRGA